MADKVLGFQFEPRKVEFDDTDTRSDEEGDEGYTDFPDAVCTCGKCREMTPLKKISAARR